MEMMHQRFEDLRYAVRTLLRAPMTVAVTVLSLALGIAAVTTVFMVSEAILAPPAAGLDAPEQLVSVYTSEDDGEVYGVSSYPDFESVSDAPALMGTAVAAVRLVSMDDDDGPTRLLGEVVSGNYFSVMGIVPVVGRTFLESEGWPGPGEAVAVLGFDLWQERFSGDPAVVGRVVSLNGQPIAPSFKSMVNAYYDCGGCAAGAVQEWSVTIAAARPDLVEVVTFTPERRMQ